MDNILVELERIDHIAESEAAAKTQLDNPIAMPAKPEIEEMMAIEAPTKPEIEEMMTIEAPARSLESSEINGAPTEIMPENLATEASDLAEESADKLADLPSYLAQVYRHNRGAFITVGLFFGAIVTLKLILAIVAAVDTIPLFEPLFQTIGLGYTGWFVYRYLLHASTRKELAEEINTFKSKVTGKPAN
jgi:CAAD domains of cyanobacterial aminoacyl-tRNA synthetase